MNPPQPTPPSDPPASRLVAIWVPDWPVVALTMEARQRHRHPRAHQGAPHLPDPATEPVAVVGARGVLAASAPDGAHITFFLDSIDDDVQASFLVRHPGGYYSTTEDPDRWPELERYLPRSEWPEEIYAGQHGPTERHPDPAVTEAIAAYRRMILDALDD